MNKKLGYQLAIILIIVISYFGISPMLLKKPRNISDIPPSPTEPPISVPIAYKTKKIGFLWFPIRPIWLQGFLIVSIVEEDIPQYLAKVARNESYEFEIPTLQVGTDKKHQKYVKQMLEINEAPLIIGGYNKNDVIDFINDEDAQNMFLFSPIISINRTEILMSSDNSSGYFFSLMPNMTSRIRGIAETLWNHNFKAILIFEAEESKRMKFLSERFQELGGVVIGHISSGQTLESLEQLLEENVDGFPLHQICIYNPNVKIESLKNFPILNNITWVTYGSGFRWVTQTLSEYGPGFKIFSIQPTSTDTSRWEELEKKLCSNSKVKLNYELANFYDICFIYVKSYINHLDTGGSPYWWELPKRSDLLQISKEYVGVTGNCSLTPNGDRKHTTYKLKEIMGAKAYPFDFEKCKDS